MGAIVGGLVAAACWAAANLCTSRSSRMLGAPTVLAWVMLVGFVLLAPFVATSDVPEALGRSIGWLALSGVANVVGLLAVYTALRRGTVGVVSAITPTEGAIAATISIAAGEPVGTATGILLAVIAAGVFLSAFAPGADGGGRTLDAAVYSFAAAICFGVGLYAAGRVSGDLPAVWTAVPARVVGVAAVTLPLALQGKMRITRRAIPLVVGAGSCEVVGFLAFVIGARHSVAVTAVIGSQLAALAAIGAFVLFRERLTRLQVGGLITIGVSVGFLTAIRA